MKVPSAVTCPGRDSKKVNVLSSQTKCVKRREPVAGCPVCGTTVNVGAPPCVQCALLFAPPVLSAAAWRSKHGWHWLAAVTAVLVVGVAFPLVNLLATYLLAPRWPPFSGPDAPERLRLELIVRPEIDALRIRNYGGRTLTCAISVWEGASVRDVYIGPGRAEFIRYSRFAGLEPDEAFLRARQRVSVACTDPNGALASSIYMGINGSENRPAPMR